MSTKKSINNNWAIVLLAVVILASMTLTAVSVGSVYAESNSTPTSMPASSGTGARNFLMDILEKTHKFQTNMIDIFRNQLKNADKVETRAQQRIAELKKLGKDVSSLENMLSKFSGLIVSAKQAKDKALASLNLHQGFDAQGKVTDLKLAQNTTKDVQANIRVCRENIIQALKVIANGLTVYKQQNSPQPASSIA